MFSIAFDKIPLEAFQELPDSLRTEAFFRSNELTNAYVDARAREVVLAMGARPAVSPERKDAWHWLERKIRRAACGIKCAEEIRFAILAENAALTPALDLIDASAEGYPAFLRGEREGSSILFDPAKGVLWDRYFSNENPVYGAGNTLAAHAASLALGSSRPRKGLRVLEVGAGCGSAAEVLVERLGLSISSYAVTDISPNFLRKARERLSPIVNAGTMEISFQLLDLNREAPSWPGGGAKFDVIYAVNVLHAVKDLLSVLRGLRNLLADGGVLVLGECVRPARGHPVHPEFIFQLLDEFRTAVLDPDLRPEPGFLDAASWRACLARSGFGRVRFVPEFERAVEAYPEHSLAAIIACPDS